MTKSTAPDAKTVFIVTEQDYESFCIWAVFATRELAEEYKRVKENGARGRIEEYVLNAAAPRCWSTIEVFVMESLEIYRTDYWQTGAVDDAGSVPTFLKDWWKGELVLRWAVNTDDEEKARKVVLDKAIVLKNMEAWGNNDILTELIGKGEM